MVNILYCLPYFLNEEKAKLITGERILILGMPFFVGTSPLKEIQQLELEKTNLPFIKTIGTRLVRWISPYRNSLWPTLQKQKKLFLMKWPMNFVHNRITKVIPTDVDTLIVPTGLEGVLLAAFFLKHFEPPYPDAQRDLLNIQKKKYLLSNIGLQLLQALGDPEQQIDEATILDCVLDHTFDAKQILQAAKRTQKLAHNDKKIAAAFKVENRVAYLDISRLPKRLRDLPFSPVGVAAHGLWLAEFAAIRYIDSATGKLTILVMAHPLNDLAKKLGFPGIEPKSTITRFEDTSHSLREVLNLLNKH